jgi:hypothetical protein
MSNYKIISPRIGVQRIDQTDTAQNHELGAIVQAKDVAATNYGTGEFIYLKGAASTVAGSVVTYSADDFTTSLLVADAIGPVAVAMSANVAGQYGWYQVHGKAVVKAGTVADNANVYGTATPGQVDDAAVAGDRVKNARFASADGTPSAGLAECEIHRPFVDDGAAA